MGGYAYAGDSISANDPRAGIAPGDFDLDGHFEWLVREIDAMGGVALSAAFGQDEAADVLRPGPILAALTAQAVSAPGRLSDNELIGVLHAARRLANLAAYQQTVVIAEFARRRQAEFEAAKTRGVPVGCRPGEFPGEELAMELVDTGACTGTRIDAAVELTSRLPRTLAGMKDGTIDLTRAGIIASRTRAMADADAACADEVLASVAPGKRPDQLAAKAAALEMKLAPDAVRARRETAKQLDQRVEARREESGNASLAGRELDTADVMASKAHIDAIAVQLRNSGLIDGTLGHLRALTMIDLTQGRDPLDRIRPKSAPAATPPHAAPEPGTPIDCGAPVDEPDEEPRRGWPRPGDPAPLPALINLTVPVGTLLGWGNVPAAAAGWGLLNTDETATLVRAASEHPRSRWCVTVLAPDGTAIAHGCAAGRHPWPPDDPAPPQAGRLLDLLRRLNITLEPIARDSCDHAHAENRYVPGRALKHLLRARHQTCTAPACNAQAQYCDIDHTIPYPDGPTCECNTSPKCRRHHRTKQAPGWQAAQPAPGTISWATPSGRTHTATPTVYEL
ncbi:MAG TPA: DUF222 domain-containing protein [Trebonia sp.]|nr:DUF222 domain-containing protein [Trebonia sp.]